MPNLSAEHLERIRKLQQGLREIPEENFDLGVYFAFGSAAQQECAQRYKSLTLGNDATQNLKLMHEIDAEIAQSVLAELKAGERNCGTAACVAGWLPAIFPEDAKYINDAANPTFIRGPQTGQSVTVESLAIWLGFPLFWGAYLFCPEGIFYGTLSENVGADDVIDALDRAVGYYEKGTDPLDVEEYDEEEDDDYWDDEDDYDDEDDDEDDWDDDEDE